MWPKLAELRAWLAILRSSQAQRDALQAQGTFVDRSAVRHDMALNIRALLEEAQLFDLVAKSAPKKSAAKKRAKKVAR